MKKFQIVTEMKNRAMLFNTATCTEEVDAFVDEFGRNEDMKSIKVYRCNMKTADYRVVYEDSRETDSRMIGFGRW